MQQNKIYFAVALVALLVFGFLATSIASYFIAHDSLSERISEETLPLTSDNIYSEIERDLLRSILISSLMAHDTFVRDWMLGGEEDPERMIRYLKQIQKKYDTTTAFFVSDHTRRYYHTTGVIKTVKKDDPGDSWYFRVRDMNDPYEINIDADTADRTRITIFINYRVKDYEGEYIGVTGIGLSVDTVSKLIENYQKRYGRQIYFVNRQGKVTVRGSQFSGPDHIQDRSGLERYATRILANPSTSVSYERPDGQTVYVNSRLVPEFDWYLIVEQSKSAAETRLLNTLTVNMVVALVITAFVVIIAYFTLRGYQRYLEDMATTDGLTGAANRQALSVIYNHVTKASKRDGSPVAVLAVDIDGFKEVNDTYGHQAGDTVLRKLTGVLREELREVDTITRLGGDEFMALMGNCTGESAERIGERIRERIKNERIRYAGKDLAITVSIGVVEKHEGEDLDAVMKRADEALYESKHHGRDRVTRG